MDITAKIKDQIISAIGNSCAVLEDKKVFKFDEQGYLLPIEIEIPKDKKNGDFSSNIAMKITKLVKKNPCETAQLILDNIDLEDTYIDRCEIAGPGFINFYLKKDWLYDALKLVHKMGADYGKTDMGNGEKVVVEFVSANPTGPMHMGNARGGVIGDVLSNILKCAGYDVTKEFYINDAGAQIEKFGYSLEARYIQALRGDDAVEFSPDWYQGDDIKEHAKNYIEKYGDILLEKDGEERRKALVDYALPINIENLKKGLLDYKISYDVWFPGKHAPQRRRS